MAMSTKEKDARIAELEAQVEKNNKLTFKVSVKGAVQVNGLGRFPTTLYKEQMTRLLDAGPAIREFMVAHDSQLTIKE